MKQRAMSNKAKNYDNFYLDINAFKAKYKPEILSANTQFQNINISNRELQCAILMSLGKTSKEAASELSISCRTVEVYIERLKAKFKAKNKVHLMRLLIESGLI